jgi:hypothetical protein
MITYSLLEGYKKGYKLRLFFIILVVAISLYGEDEFGFDDSNDFDNLAKSSVKSDNIKPSWFDITFGLSTSYNYNQDKKPFREFSSFALFAEINVNKKISDILRFKVNNKATWESIYMIKGKSHFNDELVDSDEVVIKRKELYLEYKPFESLDIRVGEQIIVWGKSDSIRVTDVLNPIDATKLGLVDIEDLRLSLLLAKATWYMGNWSLSPIIIFDNKVSKTPSIGSDFNYINKKVEKEKSDKRQYAVSLQGEFNGFDIGFYGAKINNDTPHFDKVSKKLVYEKIDMFGVASNIIFGSFLLKTEFAFFDGIKARETNNKTYNKLKYLFGFDYTGINDTTISIESSAIRYDNLDCDVKSIENNVVQTAMRFATNMLNNTLGLNYLLNLFGDHLQNGGFQRAWMKYDFGDGLIFNLGVVDYISDDKENSPFNYIRNNDRVFADMKYSF